MLTLTLQLNDKVIQEYQFQRGKTVSIGRRTDNDIVIENLGVSGRHAKIELRDKGFLLTDLESKNGSFVNERRVSSQWLKNSDVITIGKHTLLFSFDEERHQLESTVSGLDETMAMDTDKYRSMLTDTIKGTSPQQQNEFLGILSFIAGGEGEIVLSKKFIKIGKNPSSDIFVNGFMVNETAATISKRVNGYYLSYAGGIVKPKVNGKKIKESIRLKEWDIIKIGRSKMQLTLKK